jgi:hypothetical protein
MVRLCEDYAVGDTRAGLDCVEFYEREFDHVVRAAGSSQAPRPRTWPRRRWSGLAYRVQNGALW